VRTGRFSVEKRGGSKAEPEGLLRGREKQRKNGFDFIGKREEEPAFIPCGEKSLRGSEDAGGA